MKNEFDKNLTDKSWQSMRRLLDREMPEQHRRRPIFWWWFGAFLLLPMLGVGGWWLFQPSKPVEVKPPVELPKVFQPVVKAEFEPTRSETETLKTDNLQERKANAPDYLNAPDEITDEARSSGTFLTLEKLTTVESESLPTLSSGLNPSETSEFFQKIPVFATFGTLPTPAQFVENENKSEISLPKIAVAPPASVKKHSPSKKWSFGVATAMASESVSALNGFSTGLAVDWQPARRWGVRSGLQYAQYHISNEKQPILAVDGLDYAKATGNFNVLDSNTIVSGPQMDASGTVLLPVERLRRLEMPLLAFWQPVRSLRIFGGVSPSYNLSVQASQQSFANNQVYEASGNVARKNLNELAANTLSRWQMDWQAGIAVRLVGRHLELGAFYKHGWSKSGLAADEAMDFLGNNSNLQPRGDANRHYFILNGILFF